MGIPKLASWMASTPRCCAWGCLVLAAAITFVAAACAHDTAKTPSSGGPPCPLADRQASGPPPPLVDASTANAVATRVRRQRLLGGLAPATQTWLRDIADRWPGPGVGLNHPRCVGWNGESACGSRCIRCDATNTTVAALGLQRTALTGSIPPRMCDLPGLQLLDLSGNSLTGGIPSCIDRLTGLVDLTLEHNALSGSIPPEVCRLAGLQSLFLNSNNLTGAIPACVGQLTSLTQLGLQDNALSGSIPMSVCSLAGLQHLVLSGNSLTGGIPVCIDRLTGLVDLALENNELSGSIPPEVCSLTGLQSLSLNSNNLTGAIPACIDQLTGLTQLELQDNTLSGSIPPGICCLAGLQYLFLNSNHLTDAIPACIDQITGLVELVLADNSLSGSIPPEICSLAGLQLLALSNNKLTGGIPACVNQLISLHYMRLDANELSGNPFFQGGGICAMPRGLKQLELSDNAALTAGPVPGPGCLCDNPDLARLGLSFTSRTGPIPACFNVVNTPLLEKLALDRNPGLTGSPIPPTLCGLQRLTGLHLHGNGGLAGPLPTCLGEMTNLVQLDLLEVPGITGSLPPGLFALPNLQYLVVSGARPLGGSGFPQSPVFKCPRSDGFTWAFTLEFYGTPNCTGSPTTCETTAVAEFVNAACYVNPISVWSKSASAASSCATGAVVHAYGDFSTESACTTTTDTINTFAVGTCIPRGSQSFVLTCSAASSCPSSTSSTDPVDSSLPSSTVSASAAAVAAAGGERRCPRISRAVDYIWQPPANLTNGTTLPWLPSAKLVAFVGCGLKGPIPSWLVNLPAINSIDLSGNELSGPLPTILGNTQPHVQNGIQLTQFAAADNQLTGTLAALKATLTTLTQLDVSNNHISGVVPSWLATRSAHMAVLKAKGNWLSCVLPDDLAINGSDSIDVDRHADGRGDVILDLLTNNVFDCPVPKSVKDADEAAPTYKCGSHSLWVSIVIVGMAQLLLVATMCTSRRGAATVAHVDDTGAIVAHNSDASTVSGIDLQFRRASAVVAVLFATTLIPAYVTSVSVLECRLGWAVTAAYLEGAASTAFLSSAPVWTWLLLVSGGIGGSAVIWWLLLIPALQQRGDKAGGDDEAARKPAPTTSSPPHRTACAALVALVWTCVSLAINIGFVYLEENSEALDALGLGASATVTAKKMAVFLFGILHELIEHLAAPWVVWLIVQQARGGRAGPDTLHMLATSVKLVASVVAPLVALTFTSAACLLPLVEQSSVPETVTTVDRTHCAASNQATNLTFICVRTTTTPVSVSYTPVFEFSGVRCTSAIITLYTPAFLTILSVRTLLLPALWLFKRKCPSRVTPGLSVTGLLGGLLAGKTPKYADAETQQIRQQIEHNTFGINTTAIGLCAGLASPLIAVAAAACLFANSIIVPTLDRWYDRNANSDHPGRLFAWIFPAKSQLFCRVGRRCTQTQSSPCCGGVDAASPFV